MISLDEIRAFLPTFLSHGSETAFLDEIKHFLKSESRPFYTSALAQQPILFQGDGLEGLLIVDLPDPKIKPARVILFSNTCDVSPANARLFRPWLTYAPILRLDRYLASLRSEYPADRVNQHGRDIRRQLVTQIFFLPRVGNLPRDSVPKIRLFTLGDFGAWLFALKLSIHFCRIRDTVDRAAGTMS